MKCPIFAGMLSSSGVVSLTTGLPLSRYRMSATEARQHIWIKVGCHGNTFDQDQCDDIITVSHQQLCLQWQHVFCIASFQISFQLLFPYCMSGMEPESDAACGF